MQFISQFRSNTIKDIYYLSHLQNLPIITISNLTGRSIVTIADCINLCRDVCCLLFDNIKKIRGQNKVIQIDESLLRGRKKYKRGRLLLGADRRHEEVQDIWYLVDPQF